MQIKKFFVTLWFIVFPLLVLFSYLDMRSEAFIACLVVIPGWWIAMNELEKHRKAKAWEARNEIPRI